MQASNMKIVGFSQLRNESEKGNLHNWIRCMESVCDYIYVYDQNSTDDSKDIYKEHKSIVTIESDINDFTNEILCKNKLLTKLLAEHPDTDWIFWMDGDTILSRNALNRESLEKMLEECNHHGFDGVFMEHYNLWRSDTYYRIDNNYHDLCTTGVLALWKNNGNLSFQNRRGLHSPQYPSGIINPARSHAKLIHRGFATDYQIETKYKVYKERGQSGKALSRLLDEETLDVFRLNPNILPEWFEITDDKNPILKEKLIDKRNNE